MDLSELRLTPKSGLVGSSVTKSVTLNGHYNFHYDEQLEKSGPMRVIVVTSWNEI